MNARRNLKKLMVIGAALLVALVIGAIWAIIVATPIAIGTYALASIAVVAGLMISRFQDAKAIAEVLELKTIISNQRQPEKLD